MIRIAYCTPSLHIPGGVERVLTTKANYLAENGNYDIYILLTDGKGKQKSLIRAYKKRLLVPGQWLSALARITTLPRPVS